MNARVADEARRDVATAIRWYNAKPGRYGSVVADLFEAAVRAIGEAPRLYSPVEDGPDGVEIREYLIKRFQQRVIYRVDPDKAVVIAVVHASKPPGAWIDRITAN